MRLSFNPEFKNKSFRTSENQDSDQVELLKQLYQRKFFSPMAPSTAFEKVKNFQKRVKSNKKVNTVRSPSTNQVIFKSFTTAVKQNTRYNESQNLVSQLQLQRKKQRSMIDDINRKKGQSRVDCFWPQQASAGISRKSWTSCIKGNQTGRSFYSRKNSSLKWRSCSRQQSTSHRISNGRTQMQNSQKIRMRALQANRQLRDREKEQKALLFNKKASENVMIDGRNLRDEANQHRNKSKQLQNYLRQLQKYAKQFKSKQPTSPISSKKMRANRFSRNLIQKSNMIVAKNLEASQSKHDSLTHKGQFADLKPWAVFDHELF